MNPNELPNMKTGFDLTPNNNDISQEDVNSILSMVTIFIEEATKYSLIYTKHANRDEITKTDIILSLKSRALDSGNFWELPETKERVDEFYNKYD